MNHSGYLVDVLMFLAASVIVVPIFRHFKASPILGYLAAGMIIGPYGFAVIGDTEAANTLAELGVVFLLFTIGLELSFGRLKALRSTVLGLGSLQVLITGTLICCIALLAGLKIGAAVIIGGGLALSSTAFVLQLLSERGERRTRFGLTTFSILLLQDLAVVPLLILVTMLGTPGSPVSETLVFAVGKGAATILMILAFGRYLLNPLYRVITTKGSSELFVATTLLIVLGTGWMISMAGLSMEMGALLAGLLLAETQYKHQVEADIRPFKGILLGLFFMTIGMSIDLGFIFDHLALVCLIVVALILGKTMVTVLLCRLMRVPTDVSIKTGFALAQGGEFGFVLFGAALTVGIFEENVAQILLAVIALSLISTPVMFYVGNKVGRWAMQSAESPNVVSNIEGVGLGDHVLIAGFGRVGQTIAKVLSDSNISYIAIDLNEARVRKCRAQGMSVYYGDADQISVLKSAGADFAMSAVITIDQKKEASRIVAALRKNYPDLPIYVRSRDHRHSRSLEKVGATEVVSEAAESSLQLGSIVLSSLGIGNDEIARIVQEYRDDDYAQLSEIV